MRKDKICRRCKKALPIEKFVDTSGSKNPKGHYCDSCYVERIYEWRQAALAEEKSYIQKLKITYGEYWRHYALPEDFYNTLLNERDYCPYCGINFGEVKTTKFIESPFHIDHMDPLHRGGEHSIRNAVVCCGPCNIRKGRLRFQRWLEKLKPEYRKLSREIYIEKHGRSPEEFEEGSPMERGGDGEFVIYQTEEELREQYKKPIVDGPPSNKPIVITINALEMVKKFIAKYKEMQSNKDN